MIDPLAPGLDLAPFLDLMSDDEGAEGVPRRAAGSRDLPETRRRKLPKPVFDTQIAAMACGYGDTIAYDALVQQVLKRRLDKSSRFTDWSRRPLSDAQLAYALADVTHLRDLYPKLKQKLESEGRLRWVDEEHADLARSGHLRHDAGEFLAPAEAAQDHAGLCARAENRRGVARTASATARRAARAHRQG